MNERIKATINLYYQCPAAQVIKLKICHCFCDFVINLWILNGAPQKQMESSIHRGRGTPCPVKQELCWQHLLNTEL